MFRHASITTTVNHTLSRMWRETHTRRSRGITILILASRPPIPQLSIAITIVIMIVLLDKRILFLLLLLLFLPFISTISPVPIPIPASAHRPSLSRAIADILLIIILGLLLNRERTIPIRCSSLRPGSCRLGIRAYSCGFTPVLCLGVSTWERIFTRSAKRGMERRRGAVIFLRSRG